MERGTWVWSGLSGLWNEALRSLGLERDGAVVRPVSNAERFSLAVDFADPPFAIQTVVEGDPDDPPEPDLPRLRQAVSRVSESMPGTRMRLAGALNRLCWIADGPLPRVRVVSGEHWRGVNPAGAPFLSDPLDPVEGPATEVLWITGRPPRLLFRALHSQMDGAGAVLFAEEVMTALRGEPLRPVNAGPPIDAEVGERFAGKPERLERVCPSLTGPPDWREQGTTWHRVRVSGRVPRPAAALAVALCEAAVGPLDFDRVRFMLPVDMRRPARLGPSSANLTGLIRVTAGPAMRAADPVAALDQAILRELLKREFGTDPAQPGGVLPLIAMPMMGVLARFALHGRFLRFNNSVILSHLGPLDLARFSAPGFSARTVFAVPPFRAASSTPLFITLFESGAGLDIVGAMPRAYASSSRLARLLDTAAAALERRVHQEEQA